MDMKRILQAMDETSTKPVEGANDMSKFLKAVSESKTNRLSTAEQMVFEQPKVRESITSPVLNKDKDAKPSMIGKYFKTVEEEFIESAERNKEVAKLLAERVANKINETPIEPTDDPNDPHIYGHEKANPMSLKGRIQQARNQLRDLAERAQSDDLAVWQSICRDAKGGMFMGLEQNLEQIRHGISELAAKRKKGGVQSRGIDKNIGEEKVRLDPKCWKGKHKEGTKIKGGVRVNNCVPNESSTPFVSKTQKTGTAGQLRGKDKVDVKGTVLGSPEKSQKGLRGKLVGGGSA